MTWLTRLAADLAWTAGHWTDLEGLAEPGTRRPYRRPLLTAEQREERDAAAWVERLERTEDAIGASPAPVPPGVLDLLTGMLADAVLLADDVAREIWCPILAPPSSGFGDAGPYLTFAARHIRDTPDTAYQWAPTIRGMVEQTARALGLVYDGQRLAVECPWCHGVTAETPAGGAHTWVVRDLLARQRCDHGHADRRWCLQCPTLIAVVCEGVCEPPSKDVGTWVRGCPAWPQSEWEWLAKRMSERIAG